MTLTRPVLAVLAALLLPACGGGGGGGAPSPLLVPTNANSIGVVTSLFPHLLSDMGTKEMALGDLVADAMRVRYGVQVAFQNGWGIRSTLPAAGVLPADPTLRRPDAGYVPGPPYDLTVQDISVLLPFGNTVVTRTVTGAQLFAVLEQGFSAYPTNNNGFPQISGMTVTFKASNPAFARVQSILLEDGTPVQNNATLYTFATNNFINAGGDSYGMLNDGQGTVREVLADVVVEHIRNQVVITPTVAGRIVVVP